MSESNGTLVADLKGEEWRPIVGYETHYEVSNLGRVRSKDRIVRHKFPDKRVRHFRSKMMCPSIIPKGTGYYGVKLAKNGVGKTMTVSVLVAEAFLPKPEGRVEVNHKDVNSRNDRLDNLEWSTHRDNCLHAIKTGLRKVFVYWGKRQPDRKVVKDE